VVLTVPRHLNFHRFDQIKVGHDQVLRNFIKSMEIKVARDQILRTMIKSVEIKLAHQIGGNLGGVEQ
jgi:hypothetical protein